METSCPSPEPHRIFQLRPIHWVIRKRNCRNLCRRRRNSTSYKDNGKLEGVEVVIDKDRASSLLAFELEADLLIMATDTDGVYLDWGSDSEKIISKQHLKKSVNTHLIKVLWGQKLRLPVHLSNAQVKGQVIGSLKDIEKMVSGISGTQFLLK